jgi:hypothetical protein
MSPTIVADSNPRREASGAAGVMPTMMALDMVAVEITRMVTARAVVEIEPDGALG